MIISYMIIVRYGSSMVKGLLCSTTVYIWLFINKKQMHIGTNYIQE